MSLSKERQTYHLTQNGWVEGSFRGDCLGGKTDRPKPDDTVLTIDCYDEIPAPHAKPVFSDHIVWESEDSELLQSLKRKHGAKPNWFGYDKQ